jgi:hypothetical protein
MQKKPDTKTYAQATTSRKTDVLHFLKIGFNYVRTFLTRSPNIPLSCRFSDLSTLDIRLWLCVLGVCSAYFILSIKFNEHYIHRKLRSKS